MNNILLEENLIQELSKKNYSFYISSSFSSKSKVNYIPQIFAIENGKFTKKDIKDNLLKLCDFTPAKLKKTIHQRPISIVKGFNKYKVVIPDNVTLLSLIKNSLHLISKKDYAQSFEKYLKNINYIALIDSVLPNNEKIHYFNLFSKKETFKSTNLKQLTSFFDKILTTQEKEDTFYSFVEKRAKEFSDINVEKKLEDYLSEHYSNNPNYVKKFATFSSYLEHKINNSDLDIFNSYLYSVNIQYSTEKASKILGISTSKIDSHLSKLLNSVANYHQSELHILDSKNNFNNVLFQSNSNQLTPDYLQKTIKEFLIHLIDNKLKIDNEYTKKWYLNKVFNDKFQSANDSITPKKIVKI